MDLGIEGLEDATPLGSGGFGTVYRARQVRLHRTVAVKVLPRATGDPTAELRFQREAAALGTLATHPNIVTVYDSGVTGKGEPYLIMELVAKGSLADLVEREGPVAWSRVLEVGVGLAGALASAHAAGILHRDIKPANVLLSDFDEPMLADFGIARMQGQGQTQSATITGSAAHLAPELLHGEAPSEASDVYALGSTLFHVLAGTPAFVRSTDQTIAAAYQRILTAPVPDLRPNGVPDEICSLLERLLSKNPGDRPATAVDAGNLLRDLQRRAGLDPTPLLVRSVDPEALADATSSFVEPDGATTSSAPTDATLPRSSPLRKLHDTGTDAEGRPAAGAIDAAKADGDTRRSRMLVAGGAAAAVLLVAVAIGTLGGGDGTPASSETTDLTQPSATGSDATATGTDPAPSLTSARTALGQACTAFASPGASGDGDGTAERPYATITALLDSLVPGDVGCLTAGTWEEDVTVTASMTGVLDTSNTIGAVQGQRVTLTGAWTVESDASHLVIVGLHFAGDGSSPPLDLRAEDVALWHVTLTNTAGPCMAVSGDGVPGARAVSLTGVVFRSCGTVDHAALVLGQDASVVGSSFVFHGDPGAGAVAIDVGASGIVSLTLGTFIGHPTPVVIEAADDAAETRIFSLGQSLMVGNRTPSAVSTTGADAAGRFQFGGNCIQPDAGVAPASLDLQSTSLPALTNLDPEQFGTVVFVDEEAGNYRLEKGSDCQGFGAQIAILDLGSS